MDKFNKMTTAATEDGLEELEAGRLAAVVGGIALAGDGYCGTPIPSPPRASSVLQLGVALIERFHPEPWPW